MLLRTESLRHPAFQEERFLRDPAWPVDLNFQVQPRPPGLEIMVVTEPVRGDSGLRAPEVFLHVVQLKQNIDGSILIRTLLNVPDQLFSLHFQTLVALGDDTHRQRMQRILAGFPVILDEHSRSIPNFHISTGKIPVYFSDGGLGKTILTHSSPGSQSLVNGYA